jgi:hypothetical protein
LPPNLSHWQDEIRRLTGVRLDDLSVPNHTFHLSLTVYLVRKRFKAKAIILCAVSIEINKVSSALK